MLRSLGGQLRRRGIVAGVAALGAAAAARLTERTALAANGGPTVLGQVNTSTAQTTVQCAASPAAFAFVVTNTNGGAVNVFSPNGDGIRADSGSGTALGGNSTSGVGLIGASGSAIGVFGAGTGLIGVRGDTAGGTGVGGNATTGVGLSGFSGSGTAIAGATTSGMAGTFTGPVFIAGDFTATGIKSAAVPHTDGSLRRLYCMESPESYFEDFGEAQLYNGATHVALDVDFATLVHSEHYHVFLTEYGDAGGLYVSARGSRGFEVQSRDASSHLTFGYRVVARRRDIAGVRLEQVVAPTLEVKPPTPVPGLERLLRPARETGPAPQN